MVKSAAISLIGGLLLRLVMPLQFPLFMSKKPAFIEHIPPGHYLGISIESRQIVESRDDAIQNAIKQIFQQIGAEYQLAYEKIINAQGNEISSRVTDTFSISSGGVLGILRLQTGMLKSCKKSISAMCLSIFQSSELFRRGDS